MAFLSKIGDKRLRTIIRYKNPLVIYVMKFVLGEDLLKIDYRYHVNTNISSMFLVVWLDLGMSKEEAKRLPWTQVLGAMHQQTNLLASCGSCKKVPWTSNNIPKYFFLPSASKTYWHNTTDTKHFISEDQGNQSWTYPQN